MFEFLLPRVISLRGFKFAVSWLSTNYYKIYHISRNLSYQFFASPLLEMLKLAMFKSCSFITVYTLMLILVTLFLWCIKRR